LSLYALFNAQSSFDMRIEEVFPFLVEQPFSLACSQERLGPSYTPTRLFLTGVDSIAHNSVHPLLAFLF